MNSATGIGLDKLNRGVALLESGNVEEAVKFFKEAGEAGVAEGYARLADLAVRGGTKEEASQWVQLMEDLAVINDDDLSHMSCYLAYEFRRGSGSSEDQQLKAKHHLERAAELGNSTAQALLAGRYRSGTDGFTKDSVLYEYWMGKAIDQGDEDALCSYIERIMKDGRHDAVSSSLRDKLASISGCSKRASDLLARFDNLK
jgi:TPR repeat protein